MMGIVIEGASLGAIADGWTSAAAVNGVPSLDDKETICDSLVNLMVSLGIAHLLPWLPNSTLRLQSSQIRRPL